MSIFKSIGGLFATIAHFVTTQLSKLGAEAKTAEEDLEKVATIADMVLNEAKAWVTSPAGRTLVSVIEAIPGVGPIAAEIVNVILPGALAAVSKVKSDATDPEKLIADGIGVIWGQTEADAIASDFNSAQALITNKVAPLLNIASDIQSALSVAQTVHAANKGIIEAPAKSDPDMDIVNETIADNGAGETPKQEVTE